MYIDATGDADLAYFSGVDCRKGRDSDNAAQPVTMNIKMYGVDTEELKDYILNNGDEFGKRKERYKITLEKSSRLSIAGFLYV